MGVVYDNTLAAYLIITVLLGGGAAWLTGRALAGTWRPMWQTVVYSALLTLPVRFLHYSLSGGTLLSPHYLITDGALLIAIGLLSYRFYQTSQMVTQYPWLFERASPLSWRSKQSA